MLSAQTPPEWRAWNEANARARTEYHDHPFAVGGCPRRHRCAYRARKNAR